MAFSYLVRSSLPRARALIPPALMDCRRKSFTLLNPSLLASSGSHHTSSTLFRFFSAQNTSKERESEPLKNKETTFGDGKGEKSDQSNYSNLPLTMITGLLCLYHGGSTPGLLPAYSKGVEEKNKERFEEFKEKVLEPGLVSKIIVDEYLALVYLKNDTKFRSVFDRDQPIEKGVYLLSINSPESFKEKLDQTQKILRLDPVPVIYLPKNKHTKVSL